MNEDRKQERRTSTKEQPRKSKTKRLWEKSTKNKKLTKKPYALKDLHIMIISMLINIAYKQVHNKSIHVLFCVYVHLCVCVLNNNIN